MTRFEDQVDCKRSEIQRAAAEKNEILALKQSAENTLMHSILSEFYRDPRRKSIVSILTNQEFVETIMTMWLGLGSNGQIGGYSVPKTELPVLVMKALRINQQSEGTTSKEQPTPHDHLLDKILDSWTSDRQDFPRFRFPTLSLRGYEQTFIDQRENLDNIKHRIFNDNMIGRVDCYVPKETESEYSFDYSGSSGGHTSFMFKIRSTDDNGLFNLYSSIDHGLRDPNGVELETKTDNINGVIDHLATIYAMKQ